MLEYILNRTTFAEFHQKAVVDELQRRADWTSGWSRTGALLPLHQVIDPTFARLDILLPVPEVSHPTPRGSLPLRERFRRCMLEIVYTWSNFAQNKGPLKSDGTVDWALTNAISCVMSQSCV